MSETWATSGIDLHLELAGSRRRRALESALRAAVRDGRLGAGTRLPSSRSLALDLGIARNTVAAAYAQLVAEGWLEARHGSGTRVFARAAITPRAAGSPGKVAAARFDLRAGLPDLAAFPQTAWLAAMRRSLRAAPYDAYGYPDAQGRPELRRALADYLARARGVVVTPDEVVVCSGFRQGLTLVCLALRARGATRLALESYGHRSHRTLIAATGLEPTTIAVDSEGAVLDGLDAHATLLTPAHQFPLGVPLVAGRRRLAVDWARAKSAVLIEDDYDGEFRYDRQPVGALQALAPELVVYAGTASKSLAPGLRLAWLVPPADLLEEILAAKLLTDGPGAVEQLALAEFITSGNYDRHIRRMRLVYRNRRDRLVAALERNAPGVSGVSVARIAAGLHAVVELRAGRTEADVVARARARQLLVEGLADYRLGTQSREPALVVGYATPPEHAFSAAVARLCAVLAEGTT